MLIQKLHLIFLFILISSSLFGQDKIEEKVISLEKKRFEALVQKDYDFLDKIFSDKLIYNHADGKIDTKNSFSDGLKDGRRTYKSIILDTISIQMFKKTAILRGDVSFVRINKKQEETTQKLRYSAVYIKQKQSWKMVSWHSTDLTPKK